MYYYLSLGSNVDAERCAVKMLEHLSGLFGCLAVYPFRYTEPEGVVNAAPFFNALVVVQTDLNNVDVKHGLVQIERAIEGEYRYLERSAKSRCADIDILQWSNDFEPKCFANAKEGYVLTCYNCEGEATDLSQYGLPFFNTPASISKCAETGKWAVEEDSFEWFLKIEKKRYMLSASELIRDGGVAFGTSGARGLVEDFSPSVCAAFTLAFLHSQGSVKRMAIAIDNRPSSPDIARACIAALTNAGVDVDYYGVIPTPALAHTSMADGIPAIMVTGSHIPFDRNGLKFYRSDGEISKADEQAIIGADVNVPDLALPALPTASLRAKDNYIKRYTSMYDADALKGKRIGIYEHSSAGRDLYPQIFEALGAKVVCLGRSDSFVPIDTEAVSQEDILMAQSWQKEHALDAVFSTDGDGDRPLLSDETGTYLRGDILCLLASAALQIDALAVPVSCNSAIEQIDTVAHVERTKIGSPYVVAAMSDLQSGYQRVAGFEANGGFLLGTDVQMSGQTLTALATRDAILPALAVLVFAGEKPISTLVAKLPKRFTASDRLKDFAREKSADILKGVLSEPSAFLAQVGLDKLTVDSIDQTDGVRMTLSDQSIVHLRPSGNAPELRCYTESASAKDAETLLRQVLTRLV